MDNEIVNALKGISTATITLQLLKKGYRNIAMRGVKPLAPGQERLVGPAYTLRYTPFREDLSDPAVLVDPANAARRAIEECPVGAVYVVDARGETDSGTIGDILAALMHYRGVAGFVTDGGIRDVKAVLETDLPCWCGGPSAPASIQCHGASELQVTIACGGVSVVPGDMIVADDDGAVVIPAAVVEAVATDGSEQEAIEAWIQDQVKAGRSVAGLYPPTDAVRAEFDKFRGR